MRLGAFYAAQFGAPPFFGYMVALITPNCIKRRASLENVFQAFSVGYQTGQRTQPLFGADWDALFSVPLEEVRRRFAVDRTAIVGEGNQAAA